jgi:hypothetical protein|tara:strand:+ start:424 stop:972 length:549 start_codon:yes stop_codon:yes gene_type:complete
MKKIIYTLLVTSLVFSACQEEVDDIVTPPVNTTVSGCTDNTATNYNALATVDDGTCDYGPNSVLGVAWVMEKLKIDGTVTTIINGVSTTSPTVTEVTDNLPLSPLHFYGDGTLTFDPNGSGTWSIDSTQLTMISNNETEELYISELNANTLTLINYDAVDTVIVSNGMTMIQNQTWIYYYER